MATVSRRQVLGAGLVAGAGALASCSSGKKGPSSTASTVVAAPTTTCPPLKTQLAQIEHVVILIQENRSFDHYFGTYRGVRGFDDHPSGAAPGTFAQPWPGRRLAASLLPVPPRHRHDQCRVHQRHHPRLGAPAQGWNGGAMDGFVRPSMPRSTAPTEGTAAMGYYTRADLPLPLRARRRVHALRLATSAR